MVWDGQPADPPATRLLGSNGSGQVNPIGSIQPIATRADQWISYSKGTF